MKRKPANSIACGAVLIGLSFAPGLTTLASADPGYYPGPNQQLYSVSYDDLCRYQYGDPFLVSGYRSDFDGQRGCSHPQNRVYGDRYNSSGFMSLSLNVGVQWPGAWQDDHGYVNRVPCGFTVSQPYGGYQGNPYDRDGRHGFPY